MENLITTYQNQVVTSSRKVAESFGKEHKHVLRDIDNLKKDVSNFGQMFYETELPDKYGRPQRAYLINKKGFQLLAMGFTGSKAIQWKLKYIDAFEAMEKELSTPKLTPAPRYRARQLSTALKDMEKTKETLQKMFKVSDGIAYAKAVSLVEATYGVQLDIIKDMLPAADTPTAYLTPTEIGQLIGKSAREVNLLLVGYGFQHKEGKVWRLDEAGRKYGEEMPYERNGHSGYQIRWNEQVVDYIQNQLEEDVKKKQMLISVYNQFATREQSSPDYVKVRDFALNYFHSKPLTEQREIANAYARIERNACSAEDIWLIIEYYTEAKGEYIALCG